MLSEELVEWQRLERRDQTKGLPRGKASHRLEYSSHRLLLSSDQRPDVEFECGLKFGKAHGDNATRIRARLP